MEYILDLATEFSQKKQTFDVQALKQIANIIIEKENLSNYIIDIIYTHNLPNEKATMGYSVSDKIILINSKFIYEFVNSLGDNIDFKTIFHFNLELVASLLHEICHAVHLKKLEENKDDFETQLLNICYRKHFISNQRLIQLFVSLKESVIIKPNFRKFYIESYGIAPHERLAEIFAATYFKDLNSPHFADGFLYELYFNKLICGYDFNQQISSPTERYLNAYCDNKFYKNIFSSEDALRSIFTDTKDFSLEDKLKYGLNVKKEDFEKAKNLIIKRQGQ